MKTNDSQPVGLVGLGLMGAAMAHRLLESGFVVVGYDLDEAKRVEFAALGGKAAGSIAEIARRCPRVIVAVFTTVQFEQVVEGEAGLLAATPERPPLVLCTTTCEPPRYAALALRAAARGMNLLEVPVSGTSDQVLKGQGVGLIGGEPAHVNQATDILDIICPRRFYIGTAGQASSAKLAVNLILGLNRLALCEGLVFAERMGLDSRAFLEVARGSAAYSQVMDTKGEKLLARDYAPQGRLKQTLKDVRLMLAEARRVGQQLPLAEVHAEMLERCVDRGEGERDGCAVIEEVRRRRS